MVTVMSAAASGAMLAQKLTSPIGSRVVSVGEEVISLHRPWLIIAILGIHILGRRGVEGVDAAIFVDVVDQLV